MRKLNLGKRTVAGSAAAAISALTFLLVSNSTASALVAPVDPPVSASLGAAWLETQIQPDGSVLGFSNTADISATANTALALAAAGLKDAKFNASVTWLKSQAPSFTANAAQLGTLIMVSVAASENPTSFGGVNLVSKLQATEGVYATANAKPAHAGLFGASDPAFDGVYRQSLAILGLEAAGVTPDAASVSWLLAQKCGVESPAATRGGYASFRDDVALPCATSGFDALPDTNATAVAVQALVANGQLVIDTMDWLDSIQNSDGGFGYNPGFESDTNSTALVVQAIIAFGENPAGPAWSTGSATPMSALLGWQLGCDVVTSARGAFEYPLFGGAGLPNMSATQQAVPAVSGLAFPLHDDDRVGVMTTLNCDPVTTTTIVSITTTVPLSSENGTTTTFPTATTVATTSTTTTTAVVQVAGVTVTKSQATGAGTTTAKTGVDFGRLLFIGFVMMTSGVILLVIVRRKLRLSTLALHSSSLR